MAEKQDTILDISAKGYIMNPEIYGAVYKNFIKANTDEKGNVIDDSVEQAQVEALRKQMHEMDKRTLSDCIEQLVTYENYGVSEDLEKFIDFCKRFVIALEKDPQKIDEYLPHYLKKTELNMYKGGFENGVKASITETINRYIDKIIGLEKVR